MKPHAKNAETATATTAPPVVFLVVRVDVLPPKVTTAHVREYLAAFIEDRDPVLMEHQLDAMGEVKAVVLDEAETYTPYTLTPEESAMLALTTAKTARLKALSDKVESEMVGRWPLLKTPEAPPRPAHNAKGEIELEFNGVGISAMPYDRLMQSLGEVLNEAERRGARGEVNLTHPEPPVGHVEMRVVYKGV